MLLEMTAIEISEEIFDDSIRRKASELSPVAFKFSLISFSCVSHFNLKFISLKLT
jgi:hypothetical protein